MQINAEMLRGFLDCMHDEADARDKRSEAIRDIVKAAKDAGYDTKAVRKVFVRERMDEAERSKQDDLLETYEHALGGKARAARAIADGVPVEVAARANGVHRATVARFRNGKSRVANEPSNATPHHPETGEISEIHRGAMQPKGCAKVMWTEPSMSGSVVASGDAVRDASAMPLDVVAAPHSEGREHAGSAATAPPACSSQEVGAVDPRSKATTESDDLSIPHFLRRSVA